MEHAGAAFGIIFGERGSPSEITTQNEVLASLRFDSAIIPSAPMDAKAVTNSDTVQNDLWRTVDQLVVALGTPG